MDDPGLSILEENEEPLINDNGERVEHGKMLPPPNGKFRSRQDLIEYVRRFSFIQGYATAIADSRKDKYVTISCDRGGTYRNRLNLAMDERKRKAGSRLIGCPFKLKGIKIGDSWVLQTKDGAHNHEASTEMSGHPSHRRFSSTELVKVEEMTKTGILPRQILSSLRQDNPNVQATSKSISNAKAKIRKEMLEGRTPIQALLEELKKGGFICHYKCDSEKRLTHLFFSHPSSIKLCKSYSNVFVMDCTYKTNKYRMPLLDVIGVSSFNTSFYACFAFLSAEREADYAWALDNFKNMLGSNGPVVIVSDRELALMNAIRVVFPGTINLLCCWHIEKDILANCSKHFGKEDNWDAFLAAWTEVIESESVFAFNEGWKAFESSYGNKPAVISYIKRTWLPFKEHFVKAWADVHLHFENRVSSRAEGMHATLKGYLQVSTNNLLVGTEKICLAVANNFHEIKTQLGREKMRVPHIFSAPLLKRLVCHVSLYALDLLYTQYKKAISESPLLPCTGYFARALGLPCAHVMRNKMNGVLNVSDIHSQWRIDMRTFDDSCNGSSDDNDKFKGLLQELENGYHGWPVNRKEATQYQLSQLINPSIPVVFEPRVQARRGRPSRSKSTRTTNSTRRDDSAFEIAEKANHCSKCNGVGHNIRTCSAIVEDDTSSYLDVSIEAQRSPLCSMDLNSLPDDFLGLWE